MSTDASRRHIGDPAIRCLGPIKGADVLVVVGRNDPSRRSASLDTLLMELHRRGLSICWYQSPIAQTRAAIDAAVRARLPASMSARYFDPALPGSLLRWALKTTYVLARPQLWWFFVRWHEERQHTSPVALKQFIDSLRARRLFVLAQSGGGIAASLIANDTTIEKLICFGYPFKHPQRAEEPRRTTHLACLEKPFLIFQGDRDDYGSKNDASRYALSPSIRIEAIDATHDYDALPAADFERVLALIADFLELNGDWQPVKAPAVCARPAR